MVSIKRDPHKGRARVSLITRVWRHGARRLGRVTPSQRTTGPGDSPVARGSLPPPLSVAVSLTFVEVIVLLLEGFSLLPSLSGERAAVGVTSVAFFLLYGGALGWCAWNLRRQRSWARSPVVLAQLIQILTATSFWGGATTYVAVALIFVGVVVLAGIFHPDSLAALAASDERDG
jgi:hypothetical protein